MIYSLCVGGAGGEKWAEKIERRPIILYLCESRYSLCITPKLTTMSDSTKDPMIEHLSASQLRSLLDSTRKKMYEAAKALDFSEAARLRDEANNLEDKLLKLERAS